MKQLVFSIGGEDLNSGFAGVPNGGTGAVNTLLGGGVNLLLILGIVAALIWLMFGAYGWITSRGDREKISSARQKIYFSIIGLFVMFLSFLLVNIFAGAFGVHTGGGVGGAPCLPTPGHPCAY